MMHSWRIAPFPATCRRSFCAVALLWCLALLAPALGPGPAQAHHEYRILLLNSYSQTLSWTADITRGVEQTLAGQQYPVSLHVEFMDTKNIHTPEYLDLLVRQYRLKYANTHFDVIITSDDNAAVFALAHRRELFGDAPMVFCGVNDEALLANGRYSNVTGVFEAVDIAGTIGAIFALQPGVKTIHLVSDETTTGRINRAATERVLPRFAGRAEFSWVGETSMAELETLLASLPQDHACLLVSYNLDRLGRWYTYGEAMEHLSMAFAVPMYGFWDFFLGNGQVTGKPGEPAGFVGGVLASGHHQGALAATMAARIMAGEQADDIPVMAQSANRPMFDYAVMKKYGLDPDLVPSGSIVVNKPLSMIDRYRFEIAAICLVMVVMLAAILLLLANIRARRLAEAELARFNRSLEEIIEERTAELVERSLDLEQANAALTKLDELKTAVLNTVSHDLRTPLTSVLGFSKLIDRDFNRHFLPLAMEGGSECSAPDDLRAKGERIRANLAIIEQEGGRLTRLVNDFLDLSKLESGGAIWNDAPLDPAPLIERAVPVLRGYFTDPAVTFEIDVAGPLPRITADPDRLLQVLGNLVGNGAKFTSRGTVRLSASATDQGWLRVAVSDTGVGIPPEHLARVFETFYQVRGDTTNGHDMRGSGMGLAICRRIVGRYGGTLTAQSTPGQGSVFIFTLPPSP
ncbi:MAG: sensor histidine kinase [Pseudodesulfovibrio sp.]|uniref:histidine kinase n=1 Tax=Pseudodesulfovibrio aespoeensis (strain ATCC 700646 / DSM 10631 / Aspo-2) TaxID=643562 RepID=E6VSG1_PSEA9|nr:MULTISPECIES: sensor histidine kinase [Pseudodesulfovibrio]MBU4192469.1 sensor histidine kinase [Pseudomonadota bacterium]ADU64304.1 ATP-binding region ATPase domain protein [Pseudodesulfovibrio aespoeensis Aspo-2]MBU4245258.1 sensor histidine kinase [Pseudomonadota bacterium]MBU4380101.1 sensor histidine kinase [Pseudomonadota bacterium]MBU4476721.1 sensor histidine kinase [Pseudomonadota bacterium]